MENQKHKNVVSTIKEKCKVCYTCVRECPAKAIKISGGQSEIIAERCIACGNCVMVCRQNAKQVKSSVDTVLNFLESKNVVVALVAPSFSAEFVDISFMKFVGMLKALGFDYVNEVSFGADLIARETRKLTEKVNGNHFITTTCPAVVSYVRKFHINLIPYLAPLVSPMVAMARVVRKIYPENIKIVFIGPCIAKKSEINDEEIEGEVDEVLTFSELREIFHRKQLTPDIALPCDFDQPHGRNGSLFPIAGGLLQSADLKEDLILDEVVSAQGKFDFIEAIKEFESDDLHAKLVDVLCCDGCIMGAGMTTYSPVFQRRSRVSRYVRRVVNQRSLEEWKENLSKFENIDLSRSFNQDDKRIPTPTEEQIRRKLNEMGKMNPSDELNCGACGYLTCKEHAIAIIQGFAEDKMCLPYSIEQLSKTITQLDLSHEQLANSKEALKQAEKLSSMGQLAAGIAHELNNPLGAILMYSHLLQEEIDKESPLYNDLATIAQEADRCKRIVSGLLNFARKNKVVRKPVNINELIEHCIKLIQKPDNIEFVLQLENKNIIANIDKDQIMQVIHNIISNAITAMPDGGKIIFETKETEKDITISISDEGTGIPDNIIKKIFDPFFTTKKMGQGTGLGLAVSYGIMKMHNGKIDIKSNSDPTVGATGTTFTLFLPKQDKISTDL